MKNYGKNDHLIDDILDNPHYKVTKSGKLMTRISINGQGLMKSNKWREVGKFDKDGYRVFQPRFDGVKKELKIHRIIYRHFHGELKPHYVVDHINRHKQDNRPSNLRLVTVAENNRNR